MQIVGFGALANISQSPALALGMSFHRNLAEDVESPFRLLVFYRGGHIRRRERVAR
jgi:hypothetical protein